MALFTHYKQLDAMDCGPTCLRMVARYYGKSYSLQYLRGLSHITREGVSMLGISDAAEAIGFRTKGYRLTWEQLRDEVPLPCIVHWNQRHFVVVYQIKSKRNFFANRGIGSAAPETVCVADPASGLLTYTRDEFLKCWLSTRKGGEHEGTAL
jgi:ATP-binding cassette, subfamily B, bacterial